MMQTFVYLSHQLLPTIGFIGRDSIEHFVQNGTSTVNVDFVSVILSLENFGGHIERRPDISPHKLPVIKLPSKTEIDNFNIPIFKHDIRWFEISVDDVHGPHTVHAFNKLAKKPECLQFWQSLIPLDVVGQVSSFAILQKNIEIRLGFLDVDKINDVLVLAFPEKSDFSFKVFQLRF